MKGCCRGGGGAVVRVSQQASGIPSPPTRSHRDEAPSIVRLPTVRPSAPHLPRSAPQRPAPAAQRPSAPLSVPQRPSARIHFAFSTHAFSLEAFCPLPSPSAMAMPRWRRRLPRYRWSDVAFGCVAGCLWVAILLVAAEPKRPRRSERLGGWGPPAEWLSAEDRAAVERVLDADGEDGALSASAPAPASACLCLPLPHIAPPAPAPVPAEAAAPGAPEARPSRELRPRPVRVRQSDHDARGGAGTSNAVVVPDAEFGARIFDLPLSAPQRPAVVVCRCSPTTLTGRSCRG